VRDAGADASLRFPKTLKCGGLGGSPMAFQPTNASRASRDFPKAAEWRLKANSATFRESNRWGFQAQRAQ